MVQTQCQICQDVQVKDNATASLHRHSCSEECQQAYAEAYTALSTSLAGQISHIYMYLCNYFQAQAVSLESHILHFRKESRESWQLNLEVFKTPVNLMTTFCMKILYPELLKTDDGISLSLPSLFRIQLGKWCCA